MAELTGNGKAGGVSSIQVVIRIALIALLLFVAARELFSINFRGISLANPKQVSALKTKLNSVRKNAASSNETATISFDTEDNSLEISFEGEETTKHKIKRTAILYSTTFADGKLRFDKEGKPSEGGDIELRNTREEKFFVEVSPSSGEAWIRGEEIDWYNRIGIWVGAICMIAIYSYLYKENQFYRFFEHILLGIAMGYGTAIVVRQGIWDKWWIPMKEGFVTLFTGTYVPDVMLNIILVFFGCLLLLWVFKYAGSSPNIGRFIIGLAGGVSTLVGMGIVIKSLITNHFQLSGVVCLILGIAGLLWGLVYGKRNIDATRIIAGIMGCVSLFYGIKWFNAIINVTESTEITTDIIKILVGILAITVSFIYVGKYPLLGGNTILLAIAVVIWGIVGFFKPVRANYTREALENALLVFAGILGLLWYFQYSKKYLWVSRIVIGVTAGAAAGLGIKDQLVKNIPQITGTFKNIFISPDFAPHLSTVERWSLSIENLLIVVIVLCVLYYFFFSFRRQSTLAKTPANMGRMFLMITLGAFFGNTFLTRVVILIDRVQFLIKDWLMIR